MSLSIRPPLNVKKLVTDNAFLFGSKHPNASITNPSFVSSGVIGVIVKTLTRLEIEDSSVQGTNHLAQLNKTVGKQTELMRTVIFQCICTLTIPE